MMTAETLLQQPNGAFANNDDDQVEIEYVPEKLAELNDGMYAEFRDIFEKFIFKNVAGVDEEKQKDDDQSQEDSNSEEDNQQKQEKAVSNKKGKLLRRMKMNIAELKQMCARPDVVEWWDATAADPKLLVFLKSYRNTVPVPRHWCQRRKYLEGKRGVEKQPFQLPDYIAATGIEEMRQAYIEKEDSKKLKQKQRERMQPKTGKMDIDYQVLHDAFFKYQTKPKLTTLGDVYYEGKEFDQVKLRDQIKPGGMLSHELKQALGMPDGGAPPPWIINMQRYGLPPSYPYLKIQGLNAPIPAGASFGYHLGGWGKPPVDEYGQLYAGDLFGVQQHNYEEEEEPVDKTKHWGDLEEDEEVQDLEEEREEEEDSEDGIESVDGLSSCGDQIVPDVIELRKQQRKEPAADERPLYQILEQREERICAATLLGTTHTYVVGSTQVSKAGAKRVDLLRGQKADKVDVTLQPEELEAMENVLPEKYEQAREEEKLRSQPEDFSDMVAENEKKRKRKMQEKEAKSNKKKDFKF